MLLQNVYTCIQDQYSSLSGCSSLPGVMQELMMNGVIGVTQPHLQQSLLPLFEVLDPATARVSGQAAWLLDV